MAVRKTNKKTSHNDGPKAVVVFWIIFAVVIVSIALFNWGTITRNFNIFKTRLTTPPGTEEELLDDYIEEITADDSRGERITPEVVIIEPAPRPEQQQQTQTPQQPTPTSPPTTATPTTPPVAPPTPPPVQTRERAIYFAQVNSDGQILQSKVTRRMPVSETPMQDVLNAMLAGPTADELRSNNLNLIPQNTRLLSATVRGSTAYLNFSEDFMFNPFGVEGYVAQLKQIVWTVTEFPNIRDVQILIDGRRVDYLAEGILIGSPIGRASF